MSRYQLITALSAVATLAMSCPTQAANPWADQVVSYTQGTGPAPGFTVPGAALGEPTRDSVAFGGFVISPFGGAADPSEVVSLGAGGELVVKFDEPVTDDPDNPFGIDLLVFGNSFLGLSSFNNDEFDLATGPTFGEGGIVSVSADGINWETITGVDADGRFPTNGYNDITTPFPTAGSIPADFTKPVDPNLDVTGLNTAGVIAGYDGSGGGAGIDLASVGLSEISYVRVFNPADSTTSPEIDGFADVRAVPEPNTIALLAVCLLSTRSRRRFAR
ncbi:MAG: hypothetical protein AAGD11_03130 [Planctomycetota bacterium]